MSAIVPAHHDRKLSDDFESKLKSVVPYLGPQDGRAPSALLSQLARGSVCDVDLFYTQASLERLCTESGRCVIDTEVARVPAEILAAASAIVHEIERVRAPTAFDRLGNAVERGCLSLKTRASLVYYGASVALRGLFGR